MARRSLFLVPLLLAALLPAAQDDTPALPELARAAAEAPAPFAAIYRDLSRPYDEVTSAEGKTARVPVRADRKPGEHDGVTVTPYEEIALRQAEGLLKEKGPKQAQAAETILVAVLRFHAAARSRPLGEDNPWREVEGRLDARLREARAARLDALAKAAKAPASWAEALDLAGLMLERYPDDLPTARNVALAWAAHADACVAAGDLKRAREYAEKSQRLAPQLPQADAAAKRLEEQARAIAKEADGLPEAKAAAKLEEALAVWPRVPGLRDRLLKTQGKYTVLRVGVRSLPDQLSPAAAWTDVEKQAVELLFERLVWEGYDDARGELHGPGALAAMPQVVSGGRQARLDPDARWADGGRVTAADVRHTYLLLASPELPGRSAAWTDPVEPPAVQPDPLRLDFRLRQPGIDPLAPLTAHLVPQAFGGKGLVRADAPEFAKAPLGSGPYVYAARRTEGGREVAVFTANPHYYRAGRPGQPHVREVRFVVAAKPEEAFKDADHPVHMLLDPVTAAAEALKKQGVRDVRTLETRRVHFLAVNHRVPALEKRGLRLALAHAIDREKVLNEHFRVAKAAGGVPHRAANGPFPPRAWACAPPARVPANLHDAERARAQLRTLKEKEKVEKVELTLKFSTEDPRAEGACREIARQLAAAGEAAGCPVKVTPVGLAPRAFKRALEDREYELAYHHHDHASEAYSLWPLFDPRPGALRAGGSNYLGYQNDAALESLLRAAAAEVEFTRLREVVHNVHAHLHDRMPLIPLWNLDTHIVIRPEVTAVGLDPLRVFTRAGEWQLNPAK